MAQAKFVLSALWLLFFVLGHPKAFAANPVTVIVGGREYVVFYHYADKIYNDPLIKEGKFTTTNFDYFTKNNFYTSGPGLYLIDDPYINLSVKKKEAQEQPANLMEVWIEKDKYLKNLSEFTFVKNTATFQSWGPSTVIMKHLTDVILRPFSGAHAKKFVRDAVNQKVQAAKKQARNNYLWANINDQLHCYQKFDEVNDGQEFLYPQLKFSEHTEVGRWKNTLYKQVEDEICPPTFGPSGISIEDATPIECPLSEEDVSLKKVKRFAITIGTIVD